MQRVNLIEQIQRESDARGIHGQYSRQSLRGHGAAQARAAKAPFFLVRAARLECAFFNPTGEIVLRRARDAAQVNQRELDAFVDNLALDTGRIVFIHVQHL
jgi:hypothetical protein